MRAKSEKSTGKMPHALLLTRYFPPEIGTAATLFAELADAFVERGYQVTVVTGFPWYNLESEPTEYRGKLFVKESVDGYCVIRVRVSIPGTRNFRLFIGHIFAPISLVIGGLFSERPNLIVGYSPPLLVGLSGWFLRLCTRAPFLLGVQDLHPQAYIDQGILKNSALIGLLERLEKLVYLAASAITVHSEGNLQHIRSVVNSSRKKIHVLPNWVDTEKTKPIPTDQRFSELFNPEGRWVVGYAGTLGLSQGSGVLLDAAVKLLNQEEILFLLVGDGVDKMALCDRAEAEGIKNVRFVPMVPATDYAKIVSLFDVGIVTLNRKVKTPVIPSKIISLMACGCPIIGCLPERGEAAETIRKSGSGEVVGPDDAGALKESILGLFSDKTKCAEYSRNGRNEAVRNYSPKSAVESIENIFTDLKTKAR